MSAFSITYWVRVWKSRRSTRSTVNRATYGGGITSAPAPAPAPTPPIEMEIKVGVHELNTPVTATVSSWLQLALHVTKLPPAVQALVVYDLEETGGYRREMGHSWQAL